jgi:hypothetical protein
LLSIAIDGTTSLLCTQHLALGVITPPATTPIYGLRPTAIEAPDLYLVDLEGLVVRSEARVAVCATWVGLAPVEVRVEHKAELTASTPHGQLATHREQHDISRSDNSFDSTRNKRCMRM